MKNSIKSILAIISFISLTFPLLAQFEEMGVDSYHNVVISPNGLSIRSQPTLKSKKLGVVPFGKSVKILDSKSYGFDTIGTYSYVWGGDQNHKQPISGQWIKAKYKNIEGFMFNAYLHYPYNAQYYDSDSLKDINKDYAFLLPGMNCVQNINYNPKMNWYGIYKKGDEYFLKKTSISFYRVFGDMLDFGITASESKNLILILGSKKPIQNKTLKGKWWKDYGFWFYKKSKEDLSILKEYGIELQGENHYQTKIHLNTDSKTQILNPDNSGISHAVSILWYGDLDGDQKPDYIFHFGEKSGQTILFLSSEAEDGDIVKPVAAYFSGYCC